MSENDRHYNMVTLCVQSAVLHFLVVFLTPLQIQAQSFSTGLPDLICTNCCTLFDVAVMSVTWKWLKQYYSLYVRDVYHLYKYVTLYMLSLTGILKGPSDTQWAVYHIRLNFSWSFLHLRNVILCNTFGFNV